MNISENAEAILKLKKKYASIDQKTETHLEGLLGPNQ
jgi:tryptophan 2,3-dioxygenase